MKKTLIAFVVISATSYLNANTVVEEAVTIHEPSVEVESGLNKFSGAKAGIRVAI